jgi:hypothetical protein
VVQASSLQQSAGKMPVVVQASSLQSSAGKMPASQRNGRNESSTK